MMYLLAVVVGGALVVIAGTQLARSADAIAEATGIGRIWIGAVLLAGATSLPELTTDIAAIRFGATDLAVGDLFGSSMANMLILAAIDLVHRRGGVLQRVALDHALAACLAICLNTFATIFVLLRPTSSVGWLGPTSLALFLGFVAGTRVIYRHTTRGDVAPTVSVTEHRAPTTALRPALVRFSLAALLVLAAAPAFAWGAKGVAMMTGLGETFVGTWLVGITTSLPELVACIAALRLGSADLAVGNLFGSNGFNMAVFFALDLAEPGNIFANLDPNHAVTGMFSVALMSIGLAAIVFRAKRRFAILEPSSLLMLVVYAVAFVVLYRGSMA